MTDLDRSKYDGMTLAELEDALRDSSEPLDRWAQLLLGKVRERIGEDGREHWYWAESAVQTWVPRGVIPPGVQLPPGMKPARALLFWRYGADGIAGKAFDRTCNEVSCIAWTCRRVRDGGPRPSVQRKRAARDGAAYGSASLDVANAATLAAELARLTASVPELAKIVKLSGDLRRLGIDPMSLLETGRE